MSNPTTFPTERTSFKQNFQFPSENEVVYETPPTFKWIPVEGAEKYTLSVFDENKNLIESIETTKISASPETLLEPGKYFWTVATGQLTRDFMGFEIAENALHFEKPDAKELFNAYPTARPAYLFCKDDIDTLLKERKTELEVLKRNVEVALPRELPTHPLFHHDGNHLSCRPYYDKHRTYCDRDLIACSLMYALTGDEEAGKKGRLLMLEICDMNPLGPCALNNCIVTDEVGLSHIRCLPVAFDLLYPLLSKNESFYIASTIAVYAQQCEDLLKKTDFETNPSTSHSGRMPAYLGGAALVLKGTNTVDDETLLRWLSYALDIYCGIFPYYGGNDGSWAEGTFYSTSYTKWYLPFFCAVERFSGKSLFNRPFYHRYTEFLLHFCNLDYENHPFGDGYWCNSDSEEWPGFFAQNPYAVYADKFGPDLAVERKKKAVKQDLYELHVLDLFLPTFEKIPNSLAKDPEDVAVFPDGGFIAMHTAFDKKDDICVLARASRFSHDSHRHADQGSFALFADGVSLISPSGYFGWGYGTKHHMEWTKNTKAHNTLLFNGEGQKNVDPLVSIAKFVSVDKEKKSCIMDMSSAYNMVTLWQRKLSLSDDILTVTDIVEANDEVEVTYPLHTLSKPEGNENIVTVERKGKKLTILPTEGGLVLDKISDTFDVDLNQDVPDEFKATMPPQYHIYYKSPKAKKHQIVVQFKIEV